MSVVDNKKAVVLVSGGLDSATVLAMAQDQAYQCHALSFDYGQRHGSELEAARRVAASATEHRIMRLPIGDLGGSALTDKDIDVPDTATDGIPVTYVPARNTVFLSIALGWAEIIGAHDIFIGANAVDYSGYPDCRPAFIEAFEKLANVATRDGVEGRSFSIHAPLLDLAKSEIIRRGMALGVDYAQTVSCYQADQQGRACGSCESCRLRRQGFRQAGVDDLTRYAG
ncbi:MAG: 7-cyano-7-deazaguanine synthase QueC [Gammaproteobacteria bacterium]|nr:MAG: 7-cyano-7-deazaguanine synthase QueC [Gammaproteobacteria bacterium]